VTLARWGPATVRPAESAAGNVQSFNIVACSSTHFSLQLKGLLTSEEDQKRVLVITKILPFSSDH